MGCEACFNLVPFTDIDQLTSRQIRVRTDKQINSGFTCFGATN